MEKNYKSRLLFIGIITVITLISIWPSINYLVKKMTTKNLSAKEEEKLKANSLPLGLDLQGGVDIQIAVDLDKAVSQQLNEKTLQMRDSFRKEGIGATIETTKDQRGVKITLEDAKEYKIANKVLERYAGDFQPYAPEDLQSGTITLNLDIKVAEAMARTALDGSIKVIRRRVDELGVTQPSVSLQGNDRIRIQLPGEKNPEKVIKNLIRPANLEFRLLYDDYESLIDTATNKLKEGVQIPVGYVVLKGTRQIPDPRTGEQKVLNDVPYIVKDKPEITGQYLVNAGVHYDEYDLQSPVKVTLQFNPKGARLFKTITTDNIEKRLAIILENYVYSAPTIKTAIPDGNAQITGNFTTEEAKELALVLKAGALPAQLKVEEQRSVEATLGAESIRAGLTATIAGTVAVAVFMVIYYAMAGAVAVVALLLNVLIIIAALVLIKATLTLPGIAGILLTIGMAVDANVLIYERIREEKNDGKPTKVAIANGFSRAFSVIFDANLTTLITSLVLLQFGAGPIQGFALTMSIGIFGTLFTGLFVSHAFTDYVYAKWGKYSTGILYAFRNTTIDFMRRRFYSYALSLAFIIAGVAAIGINRGPYLGVDFTGGVLATVQFDKTMDTNQLRSAIDKQIVGARVQATNHTNEFLVRVKLFNDVANTKQMVENAISKGLPGSTFKMMRIDAVGSEVGGDFRNIAYKSIIISLIGMLIYIWFRFELIFGVAAIIALFHDVLITTGLLTIMHREITLDVVAALLTLIGYSINDTIVIFDRIRENLGLMRGKPMVTILNASINQSLARTIITSMTAFFVVVCMTLFGGTAIKDFGLTLVIGIIVGTYSSDFVATPIVHDWNLRKQRLQAIQDAKAIAK